MNYKYADSKTLKTTVLSISLLTIMAGAAMSPALGGISRHFADVSPLFIKMILTVPSLCIVLTSLLFARLTKKWTTKFTCMLGLILYVCGGCFAAFMNNIYTILVFRAILGIGVGLIMPLSTGLISFYFKKEEQSKLLGYSAGMNNLGGVIGMIVSGLLAAISWRASFFVYLMGVLSIVPVMLFLPVDEMTVEEKDIHGEDDLIEDIKKDKNMAHHVIYFVLMFLSMLVFYILPTNFSLTCTEENLINPQAVGLIMAAETAAAFVFGMLFSKVENKLHKRTSYIGGIAFIIGYTVLATQSSLFMIILANLFIGIGIGCMIPYLNINLLKHTKPARVTATMAIMAACLYFGQFASPFITGLLQNLIVVPVTRSPYYVGIGLSIMITFILLILNIKNSKQIS